MLRTIIPAATTLLGALVSFTARPSFLGMTPSFQEWFFSEYTVEEGWIVTILIYAAVGLAVGLITVLILKKLSNKSETKES
jgi:hypothetical protein